MWKVWQQRIPYHAVVDVGWLPSRVNLVDFSCWYGSPATYSLYAKGNLTVGDTAPQSLADWSKDGGAGLKVAYFAGSIVHEVNNLYLPLGTGVLVTYHQEAFKKVESGEADVGLSLKMQSMKLESRITLTALSYLNKVLA